MSSRSAPDRPLDRSGGPDVALLSVIAVGGGLGSVLRYGLAEAIPSGAGAFPVATFATNVLGAFLLGLLVAAVTVCWPDAPRLVRPALGTGVLGGFTTFSTFAEQSRALPAAVATSYVIATLAAGLLAAWAGLTLLSPLFRRPADSPADRPTNAPTDRRAAPSDQTAPIDPDLP